MEAISSFHSYMAFLLISSLAVCIAPLLARWKGMDFASSPPVLVALQSTEYQTTLVVSLSVCVPMFLELLFRVILKVKVEFILPNAIVLTSLAIPDLIILTYVRVFLDLNFLNYLLKARLLLFIWLAFTFIKKNGRNRWSYSGLLSSFTFLCVGRILTFYKGYFSNNIYKVLMISGSIADVSAFLIFIFMSVKWYKFILKDRKLRTMTNAQYLCNIHVTAVLITCCALYSNMFSNLNKIDWYNWNTHKLTVYSLTFTAFYVIVMLFEGRALIMEMLQTKVIFAIF